MAHTSSETTVISWRTYEKCSGYSASQQSEQIYKFAKK
jgi:hypothetical protein